MTFRVVLDTNVLVSAFAFPGGPPGDLLGRLTEHLFVNVTSDYLLSEVWCPSGDHGLNESGFTPLLGVLDAINRWDEAWVPGSRLPAPTVGETDAMPG